MKSNFIRTVQSLSCHRDALKRSIHTYETVLSVLNRIQRCSILTNTIPNSATTKSIQDELFSIYSELNASKQESEILIRDLSEALHPIGYSVSCGRTHWFSVRSNAIANIQSQLSHLPSPAIASVLFPVDTIDINDSPLPPLPLSPSHSYLSFPNDSFLHPPDPYDPFSYPDSTYSINQWDTWLNSSDSPPPQPFEPVNNTNRIAVPPPITKSPNPTLASPNSPFALANQESRVSALDEKGIQRKPSIQLPDSGRSVQMCPRSIRVCLELQVCPSLLMRVLSIQ